jgi:hypothetical protein
MTKIPNFELNENNSLEDSRRAIEAALAIGNDREDILLAADFQELIGSRYIEELSAAGYSGADIDTIGVFHDAFALSRLAPITYSELLRQRALMKPDTMRLLGGIANQNLESHRSDIQ